MHETHYKANFGTAITFEDLLTMKTGIQFGDPSNYSPGPMPTTAEMYRAIGQLKARLAEFVEYYNNQRYHESLDNLTPADVYHGRAESILKQRELIKQKTMRKRRKSHQNQILNL